MANFQKSKVEIIKGLGRYAIFAKSAPVDSCSRTLFSCLLCLFLDSCPGVAEGNSSVEDEFVLAFCVGVGAEIA